MVGVGVVLDGKPAIPTREEGVTGGPGSTHVPPGMQGEGIPMAPRETGTQPDSLPPPGQQQQVAEEVQVDGLPAQAGARPRNAVLQEDVGQRPGPDQPAPPADEWDGLDTETAQRTAPGAGRPPCTAPRTGSGPAIHPWPLAGLMFASNITPSQRTCQGMAWHDPAAPTGLPSRPGLRPLPPLPVALTLVFRNSTCFSSSTSSSVCFMRRTLSLHSDTIWREARRASGPSQPRQAPRPSLPSPAGIQDTELPAAERPPVCPCLQQPPA